MPPTDREAQARELASELEWRFRSQSEAAPALTFGGCYALILAYGDRCREAQAQWQPIATAPKSERVLLWTPIGVLVGWLVTDTLWESVEGARVFPSHWMPRPAPPREEPEG